VSRPRFVATTVILALTLAGGAFFAGTRVGPSAEGFESVVATAERIRARAAEPVTQQELVRAAVRGMLDALDDPYAAFLGPEQAADLQELTTGSFVGLGIWVEAVPEGLRVASVLEGSPARASGIVPGEVIVRVDGDDVAGLTTEEGTSLLGGSEGSSVTLSISGEAGEREVSLRRSRIDLGRVQARMIEGGIAYLRPLRFASGVAAAVRDELRALLDQGAVGVVLDLRGNPGGVTEEAVQVAGLLLGDRLLALVRERGEERELRSAEAAVTSLPAAVLVDASTASAAELVAGALQDHGRATLVGTQTYGKGALLEVTSAPDAEGAVRFTTGTFATPHGHEVEGVGLVPDVAVLPGGPIDAQLDRAVRLLLGEPAT
jgi:carboxyl-terminal processing protease